MPNIRLLVLKWATQLGKTEVELNCMGWAIDEAPGPVLVVYPSEKTYKKVSSTRIQPMINACDSLSRKKHPNPDKFKIEEMHFTDCILYLATAQSPGDLASTPIQYFFGDELGKWPLFSGKEGDPVKLGTDRQKAFPHTSKTMLVSSPTTALGQISRYFSTCQITVYFWVPCPHCKEYQRLSFDQIRWDKLEGLDSSDPDYWAHAEATAVYVCMHCEGIITDRHKMKMLQNGRWMTAEMEEPDFSKAHSVALQLSSIYSPLLTFGKVAREFLECKDDPNKLMNFVNGWLAEEWEDQAVERKDPVQILETHKTDLPAQTVPQEAVCLTMGIDTQLSGFPYVVRAWMRDKTSYLVDYGIAPSFQELQNLIFERAYPILGTGERMGVWRAGIDTGGTALDETSSMTEAVYTWLRQNSRGVVFGVKGASHRTGKRIQQSVIDKLPGFGGRPLPGGLTIFLLDTIAMKEAIHYRLSLDPDQPGAFLLNASVDQDYVKQLFAEEKRRDTKTGREKWVRVDKANHFLDCEAYCVATVDDEWLGGLRLLRGPQRVQGAPRPINHASQPPAPSDIM